MAILKLQQVLLMSVVCLDQQTAVTLHLIHRSKFDFLNFFASFLSFLTQNREKEENEIKNKKHENNMKKWRLDSNIQ